MTAAQPGGFRSRLSTELPGEASARAELRSGWLDRGQQSGSTSRTLRRQVHPADELDVGPEVSAGWWASGDIPDRNTDCIEGANFRRKAGLCFGTCQT